MSSRTIGIFLLMLGIALGISGLFLSKGYHPSRGFLGSLSYMTVELGDTRPPCGDGFAGFQCRQKRKAEGELNTFRYSIPLRYWLVLSLVIGFSGAVVVVSSSGDAMKR